MAKGVNMSQEKVGAVMVVGGGIAGIQSALDLADAGYYVYLVEKTAGIGGVMSQSAISKPLKTPISETSGRKV